MQAGAVWLHRSFPTQDGPIQLYYTDVLADLLRGGGTYSAYFRLNSHVPVYCFFNYAMLLLNQVFTPLTSERILVCLNIVAFSFGARFLIHSIDRRNDWLPFFFLPFAFHLYLYLGIYNFAFGIATLLFAMGVWLRSAPRWTWRAALLWLALLATLCTMHQLTLVFLGVFILGHALASLVGMWRAAEGGIAGRDSAASRHVVRSVAMAVPVGAAILWVVSLSSSGLSAPAVAVQFEVAMRLGALQQMIPLSPFSNPLYRLCLLLFVLLPVSLITIREVRASLKDRPSAGAASFGLALTAAVGLAMFLLAPQWFFGAGYFAARMSLIFVVCCLAALAPLRIPGTLRRAALCMVVCLLPLLAVIRYRQTDAIVNRLAPLYDARPLLAGQWGAIVSGEEYAPPGLLFNPYYWAGGHYARQGRAVLLNAPWISGRLAIITQRSAHAWDGAAPDKMLRILSSAGQQGVASKIGFVCGGKWDYPEHRAMASSASLTGGWGFVRLFESEVYYCDGKAGSATPPESPTARLQATPVHDTR